MTRAHTIVAQACLGLLLHLDENITKDSLKDFPLAGYAAEHWVGHARFESVSSKVHDGMKRLFDPRQRHLSVWVWIYDPEDYLRRFERSQRPSQARATSLHYAAFCGIHDIAAFLIVEHSQDVNARGFFVDETPLHVTARRGDVEFSRVLLEHGADIEARDEGDWSPLERAMNNGHVEITRALLEHGVNVNAQDTARCTPLYWASRWGNPAVVRMLLKHGADVKAQDEDETPLHEASVKEVAQILLEHGADANALETRDRTPLHFASENGRVDVVRVLLEHGVDANARDAHNATPTHLASLPDSIYREGERLDVVRLLLQYGSDIHALDNEGHTPFMRATESPNRRIMQLLLENGAEDDRK